MPREKRKGVAHGEEMATLARRIVACRRCPRLVAHRESVAATKRKPFADWEYWGRPVPGSGDPQARLVVIGLAPAAHGANRTGRMFTGDATARFLMRGLHRAGFANQPVSEHRGDGLVLRDVWLTAAVRCAPPDDKPTGQELAACAPYLEEELKLLPNVKVALTLGRVAFDAYMRFVRKTYGVKTTGMAFRHGVCYEIGPGLPVVCASYHTSPRNTQTGKLTEQAFDRLLAEVRERLKR